MTESTITEASVSIGSQEEAPIRVLHVDDDAGFLRVAKQCLGMQGNMEVSTASSVTEALMKLRGGSYDAIVSDYQMPEKDGLEFLKELRENGNNIPFIIFTGKGREEIAIKALNLGASRYFNKIGAPETVYGELEHGIHQVVEKKRAEEALRESEEKWRSLFANMLEGFAYCKMIYDEKKRPVDFEYLEINDAFEKLTGLKREDVVGKRVTEAIPGIKKAHPELFDIYGKVASTGKEDQIELHFKPLDIWLSISVYSPKKGDFIAVFENVTDRKKAEQENLRRREFLTDVLESMPNPFYVIDPTDYTIKLANSASGFGELSEKPTCYALTHNRDRPCSSAADPCPVQEILRTKKSTVVEHIHYDNNGNPRYVEIHAYPILDDHGNVRQMIEFCRDITERKRAEEELRKSAVYLDLMSDALMVLSPDARLIKVNRAFSQIWGYSPEEILGKPVFELFTKEEVPKYREEMEIEVKTGTARLFETIALTKKGKRIPVSVNGILLKDMKGKPLNFVASFRDITEHKKAEQALKESEERHRSIVELAPDGIVTVNKKGVVMSINPAFSKLTGFFEDELVGKHFTKIGTIRARDIPRYLKLFSSVIRGKTSPPTQFSYVHKDGTIRWGEAHVGIVKGSGKRVGFQAILRDVTERKHAEKTIQEKQQKFKQLFKGNPEAAVYVDSNFRILDTNPRFSKLFGYSMDETKGRHINDLVVPKHLRDEADNFDEESRNGYAYRNAIRKRKDGSSVEVAISAAPIMVKNQIIGYIGVYKDISQLKRTEEELKETLGKLQVVGGLTRHDIRNKLSTILGRIYLAKKKLNENQEASNDLEEALSAIGETERILDFARTYEQLGIEKLTYVNVSNNIKEAISLLPEAELELERIKVVDESQGLTVLADSLLRQLFYNLIHNSLIHGKQVEQMTFRYTQGKDHLKLIYEDNGIGIPKTEKEKIFKERYGKGTGYGLYLIKKMCQVYGWTIKETGKQGKGVQFTMTIPRTHGSGREGYRLP